MRRLRMRTQLRHLPPVLVGGPQVARSRASLSGSPSRKSSIGSCLALAVPLNSGHHRLAIQVGPPTVTTEYINPTR
jgi:hypothetical protein